MGIDPVMIAVLATVIDVGKNLLPTLDSIPEQFKDASGHIRMAYQAMWLPQDLRFFKSRNPQEYPVGICDTPLQICFGNNNLVVTKRPLFTCGFNILTHSDPYNL
jgi:hypothetical protein